MASIAFHKFLQTALKGDLDFDTVTVNVMLVASGYTPDKDHDYRNDITNEITGTGYTAGGATVTATLTRDTANDRIDITFAAASWPSSTLTARYAVYYIARGGASSADDLIMLDDFGANITSTADTFSLGASTARFQF